MSVWGLLGSMRRGQRPLIVAFDAIVRILRNVVVSYSAASSGRLGQWPVIKRAFIIWSSVSVHSMRMQPAGKYFNRDDRGIAQPGFLFSCRWASILEIEHIAFITGYFFYCAAIDIRISISTSIRGDFSPCQARRQDFNQQRGSAHTVTGGASFIILPRS